MGAALECPLKPFVPDQPRVIQLRSKHIWNRHNAIFFLMQMMLSNTTYTLFKVEFLSPTLPSSPSTKWKLWLPGTPSDGHKWKAREFCAWMQEAGRWKRVLSQNSNKLNPRYHGILLNCVCNCFYFSQSHYWSGNTLWMSFPTPFLPCLLPFLSLFDSSILLSTLGDWT